MMNKPKAFLFDLNGTIIDDMHYHSSAWYDILNDSLGANMTREQVKAEMYGKNSELLIRVFGNDHFSEEEIETLSVEKEKRYQEAFRPNLKLIDGLDIFLEKVQAANIQMAVGSAAIPFNIDFVLDGLNIRHYFNAIISAADVATSKPHPETFLKCAAQLGIDPKYCVVFEDAPKGVESAQNAGMPAVVLTTMHEKEDFAQYSNILGFIKNYEDPFLNSLW